MGEYVQAIRKIRVTTPLGDDALLLKSLSGTDEISRLFGIRLEMLAENRTKVPFDAVLGQKVTVHLRLPDESETHLNGLCVKFAQSERDTTFTLYSCELVPDVWRLTRKAQSRIFQQATVPEILKKVFKGFAVDWQLSEKYEARDYCVQYRETDFNFGSRLMEEEGIRYWFRHSDGDHQMVVSDSPLDYPELSGESTLLYEEVEGGTRDDNRIWAFTKEQEMRPGKYVLWDHCFELPHKHLEAETLTLDSVAVGRETHTLKLPGTDEMEVYDYPGEYAQRFDGVARGGGERHGEIQKIFDDNRRTVEIRMDEETTPAVSIRAKSNAKHLVPGYRFTLQRHFNADGEYVITSVRQHASFGADYRSGKDSRLAYENEITCVPAGLPYRPRRTTLRPVVSGSQTAVVVGPPGEEIFTDKYGRVKVQFHWDREGKNDEGSSCWMRVATGWAGRQWGEIRIPRVGQEVVVDFLEGDPDRPIVVGSVYNADMMPPYELPVNKTQSGVKSRSSPGGGPKNFNEIRFEDKKGKEEFYQHAERNLTTVVEKDEGRSVGGNRGTGIGNDDSRDVGNNDTHTIGGWQKNTIGSFQTLQVGSYRKETIGTEDTLNVGTYRDVNVGSNETHKVVGTFEVKAKTILLTATNQVLITVGGTSISISGGEIDAHSTGTAGLRGDGRTVVCASGGPVEVAAAGELNMSAGAPAELTAKGSVTVKGKPIKLNP